MALLLKLCNLSFRAKDIQATSESRKKLFLLRSSCTLPSWPKIYRSHGPVNISEFSGDLGLKTGTEN
jgi:hypothetical protein